jgi:hypothetical protein
MLKVYSCDICRSKVFEEPSPVSKGAKLWAVRWAIIGASVEPIQEDSGENKTEAEGKKTKSRVKQTKHPQGMVSSMTANSNDDSPKSERKQAQARSRPNLLPCSFVYNGWAASSEL